jgi:3',5'-cyclic AMP phosphodiesterase CpdA
MTARLVRLLHLSDIHCGRPYVEEHVEAAFLVATSMPFDAVIVSGDLSQRAREREFREARGILDRLQQVAPVLTVPGNHDAQWWRAPFGLGDRESVHERWRTLIQPELEPVLRVPGASVVGLNSAAGIMPWTLTWNPRDLRVKGGLTDDQLAHAQARLGESASGDLRVLVVHHNIVRGRLSNRWGLARPHRTLDAIAQMSPHVVCTGHDHEERVEIVERHGHRWILSTANTLSSRMRGRRASSFNIIESDGTTVRVKAWLFDDRVGRFIAGEGVAMDTAAA